MSTFSEQDSMMPSNNDGKISHIVILIAMEAEASPLLQSYKLVSNHYNLELQCCSIKLFYLLLGKSIL